MSEAPDKDQKTEEPTAKRRHDAAQKGDVLQSRELSIAIVIFAGTAWLALVGPMLLQGLQDMMTEALSFDAAQVRDFRPFSAAFHLLMMIASPMIALFALTLAAAFAAPAMLGSLGFRAGAFNFKASKLNPLSGLKKIFGVNGLIELGKSIAKVLLIGAIGVGLIIHESRTLVGLAGSDLRSALGDSAQMFLLTTILMAGALALIALIDVPAQIMQRGTRLRMSKQEVKDEAKQTEGSPESKAAVRRRQYEVLRGSVRQAVMEGTVVLTNPTHYAVVLRYRPGVDVAPIVAARGMDLTAAVIRDLAGEHGVPMLSYPQLTRAIYYTSRTGQMIRDDLFMAVATVLAFVFNLDAALASGATQPQIDVPEGARFDENGKPES